jgi:hypothetical protein
MRRMRDPSLHDTPVPVALLQSLVVMSFLFRLAKQQIWSTRSEVSTSGILVWRMAGGRDTWERLTGLTFPMRYAELFHHARSKNESNVP